MIMMAPAINGSMSSSSGTSPLLQQGDALSIANLGISRSSQPIPLRKKWEKSIGSEIQTASQGQRGHLLVALRGKDEVMALNKQGDVEADIHVSQPIALGEGKDKIYVVSSDRNLRAFDMTGKQLWEKSLAVKDNYSDYNVYFSSPVEDSQGRIWTIQSEFADWGEWVDTRVTLLRFSPEKGVVESRPLNGGSVLPVELDQKGNAYLADDEHARFSTDFELKSISSPKPDQIFLVQDKPYSISGDKMYRVDFEKGSITKDDELLHWNSDKNPLYHAAGKDGSVHLVFKFSGSRVKKGFYIRIKPNEPMNQRVKFRKELPFGVDSNGLSSAPLVTPGGTLYLFGEKTTANRKQVYPVYAVDRSGNLHVFHLPEEPLGVYPGNGEEMIVPLKNGSVLCLEAKSVQEIIRENKEKERNKQVIDSLGNSLFDRFSRT